MNIYMGYNFPAAFAIIRSFSALLQQKNQLEMENLISERDCR